ncbi:unnamed protein product [Moneuplotes crassus]|uniref:Uncharacterized protein n=1 Tax=Euplotes crassus TaxID=5936 RepID=A0AAD1YB95_EUPCR|nr:unnamed protein product [Moneuplotes crassus]
MGVATARFINVLPIDEKHTLIPCNSELKIFSIDTRPPLPNAEPKEGEEDKKEVFDARVEFKQSVSTASIMTLRNAEHYWVAITHDGEIILIQKQTVEEIKAADSFNIIASFHTDKKYVRYGDISTDGSTIAFISEHNEDNSLVIFKYKDGEFEFFDEILEIPNTEIKQCEFDAENNIVLACSIYEPEDNNGKIRKKVIAHSIHRYTQSGEGYAIDEKIHIEDDSNRLKFISSLDKKYGCIMFHSRRVAIIDFESLQIIHEHYIEGVGFVICDLYDRFTNSFLVAKDKNTFISFTINRDKTVDVRNIIIGFTLPSPVYHSSLINPGTLVLFWESGLDAYKLDITAEEKGDTAWWQTDKFNMNLIHLSGCSVDINRTGNMVVFGDLSGRVHIYIKKMNEETKKMEFHRESPFKFQHAVRSIAFHPENDNVVMVGLMSGWIFYVDPIADVVADIGNIKKRVTVMKWFVNQNERGTEKEYVLMAASSNGDVKMFLQDHENPTMFSEIMDLHAHPKSKAPQDLNFGTMTKYSEVWSCVLQDTDMGNILKYFVTCSEDQTCKIWRLQERRSSRGEFKAKCIDTLKGHQRAVTDMGWKKMDPKVFGEDSPHLHLFASCSDDMTVRLYKVDTSNEDPEFEYLKELDTKFIQEWHTLTYMALEENGSRLAVVTQNGYLVIWDIEGVMAEDYEPKVLFSRRIHTGSIEGLKWKEKRLVTVSSDCTACVIS